MDWKLFWRYALDLAAIYPAAFACLVPVWEFFARPGRTALAAVCFLTLGTLGAAAVCACFGLDSNLLLPPLAALAFALYVRASAALPPEERSIRVLLASLLPVTAAAANAVSPDSYLQKGDYIVISPAEKWNDNGQRIAVKTTEWELTAQHSGTANGNDVQTWKYGVSDKFYIENAETKSNGVNYVRIQCKNFRESGGGRYWDIEGRSKKPGGNLHVWSFKSGAASQWFYLEEDRDGDGETFFLKNMNSNLYLAPENYFKNPKNNCGMKRNSWSEQGCNVVQSNYAFRWRIQVLNRDAAIDAGGKDKYANWMSLLPDSRYLSELNIPGTHDSGTAEGVFSPDAAITREQLEAILWRYAGSPQPSGSLSGFADADAVSAYAADAMTWAVEQGIIAGSNGSLLPKSGVTRAQTALMLQRFAARQVQ